MEKEKYIESLDSVKAVLMLSVVLGHSIGMVNEDYFHLGIPNQAFLSLASGWIGSFHIYAFTFVSGYLYCVLRSRGKYENFSVFVQTKFKRLILPYFCTAVIWAIPVNAYYYDFDAKAVIRNYFMFENPGTLWFLVMLFEVFIIFRAAEKWICSCHSLLILAGGLICYFAGTIGKLFFANYFQVWNVLIFFPFFSFGYAVCKNEKCLRISRGGVIWCIADVICFVLLNLSYGYRGMIFKIVRIMLNLLLHIFGTLFLFTFISWANDQFDIDSLGIMKLLKKYNFIIYLFHSQIIAFVIHQLYLKLSVYSIVLVNFTASIIFSVSAGFLLLKSTGSCSKISKVFGLSDNRK